MNKEQGLTDKQAETVVEYVEDSRGKSWWRWTSGILMGIVVALCGAFFGNLSGESRADREIATLENLIRTHNVQPGHEVAQAERRALERRVDDSYTTILRELRKLGDRLDRMDSRLGRIEGGN